MPGSTHTDTKNFPSDLYNLYRLRDNLKNFSLLKNMVSAASLHHLFFGTLSNFIVVAGIFILNAFFPATIPLLIISIFLSPIVCLIPSLVINTALKVNVLRTLRRVHYAISKIESKLNECEVLSLRYDYELSVSQQTLKQIQELIEEPILNLITLLNPDRYFGV